MTTKTASAVPPRGTRPSNRRQLTLDAATELFYRRGYSLVSMSDIASAVNVGASAIYRHFPRKSELLVAAIRSGLAPYTAVLETASTDGDATADLAQLLERLAECALDHRRLGVLWQREARNLDDDDQRMLREELRETVGLLAAAVQRARPDIDSAEADLLAWCMTGALVSIGFHSLSIPRTAYVRLLVGLAGTLAAITLPAPTEADEHPQSVDGEARSNGTPSPDGEPESRREVLISTAMTLFAERGFAAVGVDDIGESVGIAGPSIYSHFASKQTILVAAIERGNALLHSEAQHALASDDTAEQKLGRLIDSYVRVANRDRAVIRTLLSEMHQLEPADREIARRHQHRYIDSWTGLLQQFTAMDPVAARIRVQAVLLVVNDAVQTPHLRCRDGFEGTLRAVATALLLAESHAA